MCCLKRRRLQRPALQERRALTENAAAGKGLGLEVLNVVHFPVDDGPEAPVFIVVLQVGFANEGHLLIVSTVLSRKKRLCI